MSLGVEVVRVVGVEPTRPFEPQDFKFLSAPATI